MVSFKEVKQQNVWCPIYPMARQHRSLIMLVAIVIRSRVMKNSDRLSRLLSAILLALPLGAVIQPSARAFPTTSIFQQQSTTPSVKQPPSSRAIAQEETLTPQQVKDAAQKITVRVTSTNNGGSGVLIAQKGTTYLVLTNRHVVGRDDRFQIQTPDGTKHTAKLVPNTKIAPKYDIALLQFTTTQKYALADLDNGSVLAEQNPIYSVGYPYDSNRTRVSVGKVTQLSDVPLEDGTQIGYQIDKNSPEIKQGMSGGPIVDGRGVLLGINTIGSYPILPSYTYVDGSKPIAKLASKYRQANWGVPVYNLLTQLDSNILYGYDNFPKVQRQITPTGYMAKLNRETRQQTVRIEAGGGNGSGVIVAKQGNTYYVLTAKHVVEDKPNVRVIAYDQESYQIQPSEIKLAKGLDLAVVKFTSTTNYPIANIGNYSPTQNATVFVGGYPGRDKIDSPLWQWQLNPGYIDDKERGKVQTQDKQSFSNGYDLLYSSISYGGMSGGPVFDTAGRVIGIHGKAEGDNSKNKELILGQSLGISIQTFLGLTEPLQVPKLSNISSNSPVDLTKQERDTIVAVRDNIAPPQAESSGEQWLQYGNQLYRIGKLVDAAIAFDKAIAKGREYQLFGNYGKALALLEINNSQALTAISSAIDVVPAGKQVDYYYLWKYQSGISRYLGKYDDALRAIEIAIKLEPSDLNLLNEKAQIFSSTKRYGEAIEIYSSLIDNKQPEAYVYLNRGNAKSASGQKQAAIDDYDRAIAINPNYANAYGNRGNAKSDLGQKQAAIIDYNRAIAINPNFTMAYNNRGLAKYDLRQYQAAIDDYNLAIKIDANLAQAYSNRGVVKSALGQYQAAIIDFDRAIAIDSNFANAYASRGVAKSALGQNQAAIIDFDRAIAINRNFAGAYISRGLAKSALKQYQAAIDDYGRAIAIDPNNAQAYAIRGLAKSALGQKQEAINDLTKAAELFRQQGQMGLYEQLIGAIKAIKG